MRKLRVTNGVQRSILHNYLAFQERLRLVGIGASVPSYLQYFDTVGWVTRRASILYTLNLYELSVKVVFKFWNKQIKNQGKDSMSVAHPKKTMYSKRCVGKKYSV